MEQIQDRWRFEQHSIVGRSITDGSDKIIDIDALQPHKVSEVICVKCHKRWFSVRHIDVKLKEL